MTSAPKPITAWAIKAPDGNITAATQKGYTDREIQDWLKTDFEEFTGEDWSDLEERGYRCVRVQITEVPE